MVTSRTCATWSDFCPQRPTPSQPAMTPPPRPRGRHAVARSRVGLITLIVAGGTASLPSGGSGPFQMSVSGAMSAPSLSQAAVPLATVTSSNASSLAAICPDTGPQRQSETSRSTTRPSDNVSRRRWPGSGTTEMTSSTATHATQGHASRRAALAGQPSTNPARARTRWMAAHSTTRPSTRGGRAPARTSASAMAMRALDPP